MVRVDPAETEFGLMLVMVGVARVVAVEVELPPQPAKGKAAARRQGIKNEVRRMGSIKLRRLETPPEKAGPRNM